MIKRGKNTQWSYNRGRAPRRGHPRTRLRTYTRAREVVEDIGTRAPGNANGIMAATGDTTMRDTTPATPATGAPAAAPDQGRVDPDPMIDTRRRPYRNAPPATARAIPPGDCLDAEYAELERRVLHALPESERKRICDRMRSNVTEPRARAYAVGLWSGLTSNRAMLQAGLDPRRDYGLIQSTICVYPAFRAVIKAAEAAQRERIKAKAMGVVEDTLDGETVSREAARMASVCVFERGFAGAHPGTDGGGNGGGGPQVIINMPAMPQSCCNPVATDGHATIINASAGNAND